MNEQNNISKRIKLLMFLWIGLIAELVVAVSVVYFIIVPRPLHPSSELSHQYLLIIVYIFVFASIPLGYFIYNKILKTKKSNLSVNEKVQKYFISMILRYGILEGAGIFALIAYVITENSGPVNIFIVVIIALLISKPSENVFKKDYEVSDI